MPVELKYPNWLREMTRGKESCLYRDEPVMVGTSGGKTSALLAFLVRSHSPNRLEVLLDFENTGREHSQTYLFLQRLSIVNVGPIWYEFRKPLIYGDPPRNALYEIVTAETCSRNGEPFEMFLETLAEFRKVAKNLGPVKPSAVRRLCTAYMKAKVSEMVARDHDFEVYTKFLGLRADEPSRIAKMSNRDTAKKTTSAPLAQLGITKEHVERFWTEQPFTLECPANLGNCDLCFLKDETHLAHNMLHEISDESREWWIKIQKKYGSFKRGTDYENLFSEAPIREHIRQQLSSNALIPGAVWGQVSPPPEGFSARRYKFLIIQERKHLRDNDVAIQCNCEASELLTDDDILAMESD